MATRKPSKTSRERVVLLAVLGVAGLLFFLYFQLLFSRYHYQTAVELLEQKDTEKTHKELVRALAAIPGFSEEDVQHPEDHSSIFFVNDVRRIDTLLGNLFFQKASSAEKAQAFLKEIGTAERYYKAAARLNPYDVEAMAGLARSTAGLEKVYAYMHKKDFSSPNALPIFERLLQLRPAGIETHYMFLRYLRDHSMQTKMDEIAERLVRIYPLAYNSLKKEQFYSKEIEKAVQKGLHEAIEEGNFSDDAYMALSDIELEQGNIQQAVSYYSDALKDETSARSSGNYLQMGRLFLKAGELSKATDAFLIAARESADRDLILRQLWGMYQAEKQYRPFLEFCKTAEHEITFSQVKDLVQASCLMEMGQYELARSHLIRITYGRYQAESLAIQSRIAATLKDWDEMEITSQRATVLEPGNSSYHSMLAQALQAQKKYPQAEEAIDKAIATAGKPNPWLYNQRGWIRWSRDKVKEAGDDWQKSIALEPAKPEFKYYLALVRQREKNLPAALAYARGALMLKPDNLEYLKKVQELEVEGKQTQN